MNLGEVKNPTTPSQEQSTSPLTASSNLDLPSTTKIQKPTKKHKNALIVFFAIFVLLLAIGGSYLLLRHGPINDTETEQDLATIAKAEIDYYNKYQSSNP